MQAVLHFLFPPQCLGCKALVTSDFGLCPRCWADTPFIAGLVCDACGRPLPGADEGERCLCDDCLRTPRPWAQGRAAMLYRDRARQLVLALKHGDRMDIARPAGKWLAQAAAPILVADMIVAPVPLHWTRLFRRRYNQAALMSAGLARQTGLEHCPDLLTRRRATPSQDRRGRDARFLNLEQAITVTPRHASRIRGRAVLLVDDVMTSGATLGAAAEACTAAGARSVSVVVLARVAKEA